MALGAAWPAIHCREPARGGYQYCLAGGSQCAAGRLHAGHVNKLNASNATLYHSLPFDLQRDLIPIAAVSRGALVLEINPSVPVKTLAEFISHSKANAGKINVASFGVGTTSHLAGELFKAMAGIALVQVPYRGDALALTDTMAGQVQATFSTVIGSFEFVRTGKLRALGVTTASRWETLPDVPTIGEVVPGYEASVWNGV